MRQTLRLLAAAGLALATLLPAAAQDFPKGPVKIIIPFPPGGPTDTVGRLIGQKLSELWGQPVVIDYKPGAGTAIGVDFVAKSPADGYTILFGNISLAFNATLYTKLRYDTIRDLAPISLSAVQPNILVIHPGLPAKNLKEFIDYARASPGKFNYGSQGGSADLDLGLFMNMAGLKLEIIRYKGSAPTIQGTYRCKPAGDITNASPAGRRA